MEFHGTLGRYVISMEFQWNSMVSRWNPMEFHGMPWNYMECHGVPWNAMDIMLFPWNCSVVLWHPGGMPWNSMGYRRLVLNLANKMAANNKFKKSFKYLGGIIFHGLEYLIRHEVVFCFIF